ncbi:MAG: hypothetical protein KAR06_02805 [Deltaproteobacteria bacterium]|nr:hypothetical protein [Deltaproteobacteria bacterium]
MKIGKAIEILDLAKDYAFEGDSVDLLDATKLGIEALKFFKGLQDTGALPNKARLPGETRE